MALRATGTIARPDRTAAVDENRFIDRAPVARRYHSHRIFLRYSRSVSNGAAGPWWNHRAALQREDAVGQRQHQVEIVLDDHDRGVPAQQVEHLEQFEHHGRRQALERLVQQQQLDIARHARARPPPSAARRRTDNPPRRPCAPSGAGSIRGSAPRSRPRRGCRRSCAPGGRARDFPRTVMPANRPRPCGT